MDTPSHNNRSTPLTAPFSVGEWRADPAANRLEKGDINANLEPKVMDLLALLASAPGRTFLRAEIDDALWPAVTVGDDTLARAVSKLRGALGDSASAPRYIETIPKRGYRLIAPVETVAPTPAHGLDAPTSPILPWRAVATISALIIMVATVIALRAPTPQNERISPAVEATDRANDLYMSFSRADNEAAIALYERAIAADPDYAAAQAGLANALVQRVIRWQTPPGEAPTANSLAAALANGVTLNATAKAVLDRAVDLGERAVRLSPRDADALKALGFAYSAQGELGLARDVYVKAAQLDGDAWEVMINLGELASIEGDEAEMLGWLERAYAAMDRLYSLEPQRIGPWRAPLGVAIGDAHRDAGDDAAAEAWYRRALDQTPFEPEATTRLAELLRRRGAVAEANQLCASLRQRIAVVTNCAIN